MSGKIGNLVLLLAVMLGLTGRAMASPTATITVNGVEQSGDTNTITVSFNGFTETVHYGPYSTQASIASAFGAKFSNDYLAAGLCAHASGATITLKLKGTAPFGTLEVTGSTTSFQLSSSGFTSQGSSVADTGTVALTVNGVVAATTSYGYGATTSSIAEGLATDVTSGSPVNVTATNDSIYVQSKQTGSGTNYSYTLQTTNWDSADFSQPSFVYPAISGNLSGGVDAGSGQGQQTIYSYSIPSYVSGSQPSGYDADGNVVGYTDSVMGTWSMASGYDQLNRLTSASATSGVYAGLQMNWGYDALGNRTSESLSGTAQMPLPTSSTASYNANNQISGTSLGTVQYDASGDVTVDNRNQYLYNGDGQVCAVKNLMFGTMIGYVYGADGTRVSTGTITTWGSCDPTANGYVAMKDSILGPTGGQLTETARDTNGSMAWSHTNVFASGELIATYDPNGLHFYLNDWTGSRRVQTDYQGIVEQTCTNLPYGDGQTCGSDPSGSLYAGLERDSDAGLDNAMYRSYASSFGRWTAPDPDSGSYDWANPQSLNRYAYVNGSPFGAVDPSGLDGCSWDPYGVYGCLTLTNKIAAGLGLDSTDLQIPFLSNLFNLPVLDDIPVTPLVGFGQLFYGLGESFGWWGGGSSFHGNVAASQSGKNVPSTPAPANYDGMADNPMAQALFHGAGQPYWGAANQTVTYATVGYAGLVAAAPAVPVVSSAAASWASTGTSYLLNSSGLLGSATARVFWSGGTMIAAAQYAEENEGMTLEMTPLGQWLSEGPPNLGWAWRVASNAFSSGAQGPVSVIQGTTVRIQSIWATIEYLNLVRNGNPITYIMHQ